VKAYVAITGVLFLLLTAIHIFRAVGERHLARDPWFVLVTVAACGLAVWAFRLLQKSIRS
jgi:hypothetical protein